MYFDADVFAHFPDDFSGKTAHNVFLQVIEQGAQKINTQQEKQYLKQPVKVNAGSGMVKRSKHAVEQDIDCHSQNLRSENTETGAQNSKQQYDCQASVKRFQKFQKFDYRSFEIL